MIDTVKFKIPYYLQFIDEVKEKSRSIHIVDNTLFESPLRYSATFPVGAYDMPILLFTRQAVYGMDSIYIEFSIPKIYFGHNVDTVDRNQVNEVLNMVEAKLRYHLPNFPTKNLWQLQRIDLCYVWKFTKDNLKKYFDYLTFMRFPRKNTHLYGTTVMFSGRSSTLRFYQKFNEFLTHGYKILKIINLALADEALLNSRGLLRYEVELRRSVIKRLFPINATIDDFIKDDFCYKYLIKQLKRLVTFKNPLTEKTKDKIITNIFNFNENLPL